MTFKRCIAALLALILAACGIEAASPTNTPLPTRPPATLTPTWSPGQEPICIDGECTSLADLPPGDAARGEALYHKSEKPPNAPLTLLCKTCHSLDATRLTGPGFEGIGSRVPLLYESVEAYVYSSIVHPDEYVREGYQDAMPKNFGDILTAQDLADLIAFISNQ